MWHFMRLLQRQLSTRRERNRPLEALPWQELQLALRHHPPDREAWEEAVNRLSPCVVEAAFRYRRARGTNSHKAEDLVQLVMVEILTKQELARDVDFSQGRDPDKLVRPFIRRLTERVAKREERAQPDWESLIREPPSIDQPDPSTVLVEDVVEEALKHRRAADRSLWHLRVRRRLRFSQVAEHLGLPVPAVRKRWQRLVRDLTKKMRALEKSQKHAG